MSAYRSTLLVRKRPVTRFDFRDAGELRVDGACSYNLISNDTLDWWNIYIPVTPLEFRGIFDRNFDEEIEMDVQLFRSGVKVSLASIEDNFSGHVYFFTNGGAKNGEPNSRFRVEPGSQGRGIGKGWMKSLVECSILLGNDNFRFLAGDDNGVHTWTRLGAEIDFHESMKESVAYFSHNITARLDAVKSCLPEPDYTAMRNLAQMEWAGAPAELEKFDRAMPEKFSVILSGGVKKSVDTIRKYARDYKMTSNSPTAFAQEELGYMQEAFYRAAEQNAEKVLSRCLFANTIMPAVIDFKNRAQMEKIESYVGGWRTIEPV